jgi:hypothetical protein
MIFRAKILPKYLSQILNNEKNTEIRQISEIELDDGERTATILIRDIEHIPHQLEADIRAEHQDVPWVIGQEMYTLRLGRIISVVNNAEKPENPYEEIARLKGIVEGNIKVIRELHDTISSVEKLAEQEWIHCDEPKDVLKRVSPSPSASPPSSSGEVAPADRRFEDLIPREDED